MRPGRGAAGCQPAGSSWRQSTKKDFGSESQMAQKNRGNPNHLSNRLASRESDCYIFSKIKVTLILFQDIIGTSELFQNHPFSVQIHQFPAWVEIICCGQDQGLKIDLCLRSTAALWFWLPPCHSAAALLEFTENNSSARKICQCYIY